MDLLVIFLFIFSYKVSGSPLEVNNDLLNDVGSLEVQGYEVHEKLFDRKEQGLPHFVTTTNHRHSSSSQESDGSSSSRRTGKQKKSVADNIGVYETSGRADTSGSHAVGKEVIKIVNRMTNSHATPYNSVLSDSIKHSIGDDATFTHKPIIVRDLTLSEVDNGSKKTLPEEYYTGTQLSLGVPNVNEEGFSASSLPALKAQHNIDSDINRYRETVRRPYYSTSGSQAVTGSVENRGSPFSGIEERKRILVDYTKTSEMPYYDKSVVDIQRGMKGDYSGINENADEEGLSASLPPSLKSQRNIDSDNNRHGDNLRTPYYSLSGSQVATVSDENSGSHFSGVEERKTVLHTTVSPKVLVGYTRTSGIPYGKSEVDNQRGMQRKYSRNDENINEEGLSASYPVSLKTQHNTDYVRSPYFSSTGSQVETDLAENNGSPYFSVEENNAVLHTTVFPMVYNNSKSATRDKIPVIDVKRGTQGEYSSNDENHSSFSSQVVTGFTENNGSPYSNVEKKEAVLHTALSPKIHPNPTSVTHDETSQIDVKQGTQGEYSSNDANQDVFKTAKSFSNSMLSSGTQHYLDHSATGDIVNQYPSQPRFILDQNIFEQYPSSAREYFMNNNGFPHPFLSTQFNPESYNSRPSYTFHHQPTLHHVEHSLQSPSKKGRTPVQDHDADILDHNIPNHNLHFPSSPDNGGLSFSRIPFLGPLSSILSYPREEDELDISEGVFI